MRPVPRAVAPGAASPSKSRLFRHSGDVGDVIYALPTIRALGGGVLRFGIRPDTRQPMTAQAYAPLVPLLLQATDYVALVEPWAELMTSTFLDLDRFREHVLPGRNLADSHLVAFGLDTVHRDRPWLTTVDPLQIAPVVFHRSQRSQNERFPWARIYRKHSKSAVFVGLPHEHALFCDCVGPVRHFPTPDLYQLARVIAGCKIYVGNQSAPLAIAEGLKVRLMAEHPVGSAQCRFDRPGALFEVNETTAIPELD